jgi:hypothetical protein
MRRRLATGGAFVQPKIAARNEKNDVLPDSPVLMMIGLPVAGRFDVFAMFASFRCDSARPLPYTPPLTGNG